MLQDGLFVFEAAKACSLYVPSVHQKFELQQTLLTLTKMMRYTICDEH